MQSTKNPWTLYALMGLIGLVLGGAMRLHGEWATAHFGQRLSIQPSAEMAGAHKRLLQRRALRYQKEKNAKRQESRHAAAGGRAVHPVKQIPNWGAMRDRGSWGQSYDAFSAEEFVPVPDYDLEVLTFPVRGLSTNAADDIPMITAKLYYSTRFFSRYDLDAGEFTGLHAGVDLKLPLGTPVAVVMEGIVHGVEQDDRLGLHVMVEHWDPIEGKIFSIYAHLGTTIVVPGQILRAGEWIGTVGMTGKTSGAHLHLQIDRAQRSAGKHRPFVTYTIPKPEEVEQWTLNPIRFIERNRNR